VYDVNQSGIIIGAICSKLFQKETNSMNGTCERTKNRGFSNGAGRKT